MPDLLLAWAAMLAALGVAGCVSASPSVVWQPISSPDTNADALDVELLWQRRDEEGPLLQAITIYEKAFNEHPSVHLSERLARAYFVLAEYFTKGDERSRERLHRSGMACALAGMRQCNAVQQAFDRGRPLVHAAALVDKEHLGPLFWYTAHLGRWICLQSIWTRWEHRELVDALFAAIRRLDDRCYYGSFYGMLGAYHARLGDMKQAAACFERAIEIAPFALGARRLYAIECAVPTRNKPLFIEQLSAALKQLEPDIPDIRPEFRLEQRLVRELLARTNEYFKD